MDEGLLDAYRRTEYRARLSRGGWATIHVDARLPKSLAVWAGVRPWSFITAWHPHSTLVPHTQNRGAQRRLLDELRALSATHAIHPGLGVGRNHWREPSLWALGSDVEALDALAARFGQHACLHGVFGAPARLRYVQG